MNNLDQAQEQIQDLITELESIFELIVDGDESAIEELQGQTGTITTILETLNGSPSELFTVDSPDMMGIAQDIFHELDIKSVRRMPDNNDLFLVCGDGLFGLMINQHFETYALNSGRLFDSMPAVVEFIDRDLVY